jgi:intraflagellar transport protein 122
MYLQAGQPEAAITILARHKYTDRLIEVMRGLTSQDADRKPLSMCAGALACAGQQNAAKEAYLKLGDYDSVIALHLEQEQWDDAVALLAHAPGRRAQVHGACARALAAQDRFEEARAAYKEAGLPEQSLWMLGQLAENGVTERRFKDAAHFLHVQSLERLEGAHFARARAARSQGLTAFWSARRAAEVYYAYHAIHHSTDQPFRTVGPDALLRAALFVLSQAQELLPGVSQVYVLQTIVKQGEALGAYKLARFAAERLGEMRLPSATWQDEVDLASLALRRQPMRDSENLLSPCARCGAPLPLFSAQFDRCSGCGHFIFRSFVTFEALPLLEFAPEEGVSHSEAMDLLEEEGPFGGSEEPHMRGRQRHLPGDVQTLRLDEDETPTSSDNGSMSGNGRLGATAGEIMRRQLEGAASDRSVVRADRAMLRAMRRSDVLIWEWPSDVLPVRYLCMVDPEVPVSICGCCNQLFEEEEWEMALLEHATCPFCRGSGEWPPAFAPRPAEEGSEADTRSMSENGTGNNGERNILRPGTGKKRLVGGPSRPGTASARPGTGAGRPTSSWGKQGAGRPGSNAGKPKTLLSISTNGVPANGMNGELSKGGRKSSERSSSGIMEEPMLNGRLSTASGRR